MAVKFDKGGFDLRLFAIFTDLLFQKGKDEQQIKKVLKDVEKLELTPRNIFHCFIGQELFDNLGTKSVTNFFSGKEIADKHVKRFCEKFPTVYSSLSDEEKERFKPVNAAFIDWRSNLYLQMNWQIDEQGIEQTAMQNVKDNSPTDKDFWEAMNIISRYYKDEEHPDLAEFPTERLFFRALNDLIKQRKEYEYSFSKLAHLDHCNHYFLKHHWDIYQLIDNSFHKLSIVFGKKYMDNSKKRFLKTKYGFRSCFEFRTGDDTRPILAGDCFIDISQTIAILKFETNFPIRRKRNLIILPLTSKNEYLVGKNGSNCVWTNEFDSANVVVRIVSDVKYTKLDLRPLVYGIDDMSVPAYVRSVLMEPQDHNINEDIPLLFHVIDAFPDKYFW